MPKLSEQRRTLLNSLMRDTIYEGAVAVLTDYGMNGLTMGRVAAAAEVAKGSLYNYFSSKLDLLHFVYDRTIEPMQEALDEIIERELSPAEKLDSIVRVWFEQFSKRRGVFNFLFMDHAARGALKHSEQNARTAAIARVAIVIEQGIKQGRFCELNSTRAAEMLIGAAIGMMEQQVAEGESRPVDEMAGTLMKVFLHGVSSP